VIDAETAGAVTSRNPQLAKAVNQLTVARQHRLERAHAGPAAASTATSSDPGIDGSDEGATGLVDGGGPA
jgi:hypothetical protein